MNSKYFMKQMNICTVKLWVVFITNSISNDKFFKLILTVDVIVSRRQKLNYLMSS